MKKADISVGVGLILFAFLVMAEAGNYTDKGVQIEYYGPAFFPFLLSGALIVAASALIVNAARGRSLPRKDRIDWPGFRRVVAALGIGVIYWFTIDYSGFPLGTFVFLFAFTTLMGARSRPVRLIVSITVPLAVWALFEYLLVITLPESSLLYGLLEQ